MDIAGTYFIAWRNSSVSLAIAVVAVACATGTIATIAAVADDDEDDDDDDGDECSSVRSCPTIFFARDAFGVQFVRHRGQSTTNEYISTYSTYTCVYLIRMSILMYMYMCVCVRGCIKMVSYDRTRRRLVQIVINVLIKLEKILER